MATGCRKLDLQTLACSRCMDNGNWGILHRIQMPHGEMLWCSWELGVNQVDKSALPLAWQGPHGSQMVWNRKENSIISILILSPAIHFNCLSLNTVISSPIWKLYKHGIKWRIKCHISGVEKTKANRSFWEWRYTTGNNKCIYL